MINCKIRQSIILVNRVQNMLITQTKLACFVTSIKRFIISIILTGHQFFWIFVLQSICKFQVQYLI